MTEIRQCWAYSADGVRCEHPAGHQGNHVITREWSDEECFEPITLKRAAVTVAPQPAELPPPPAKQVSATRCAACGHSHSGGVCKCGCYEQIG